jgi:hypothetical protein
MVKKSLFVLAACFAVACNSVLGIDEATRSALVPDAGPDAAAPTDDCPTYCATINKNCTGVLREYHNDAVCLAMCAHFDLGPPGAETGDNLACRLVHSQRAATDPLTHCPHAGPLGGSQCGQICEAFCLQAHAVCSDLSPFESEQTCQGVCNQDAYREIVNADAGDLAFGYETPPSQTINCRLEHLENAVQATTDFDRKTHCGHAQLNQTNVQCAVPGTADAGAD